MALDALWTVELEARGRSTNGGVIVLKNGHILGGNNTHYYVGTFTTGGTKLEGQVRIAWYSGSRQTAWGDEAEVVEAKVTGEGGPNTITGKVSRSGHPDISFRMAKRAELPS
jgi:T3SS negative regulator,GrlR